jgi:hypothetical protein
VTILLMMGCVEPPLLDRIALAYGATVVATSEQALGLFVSVGAVVAEPCAAENIDTYALTGQGNRALRVTTPAVTIEDSGGRSYAYGAVAFGGDVGELTLTSDANRKTWAARYEAQEGTFTGTYILGACEVSEEGIATTASIAGTGAYVLTDGTQQDMSITGGEGAMLSWSPATAAVPAAGEVTWHITADKLELALVDAGEIEPVERSWLGVADGGSWEAEVGLLLP